jgi:hypothetical protein
VGLARHRLGGETALACQELAARVAKIGAALLQTDAAAVEVRDGRVFGPRGSVSLADIARACYLAPADSPNSAAACLRTRPMPSTSAASRRRSPH